MKVEDVIILTVKSAIRLRVSRLIILTLMKLRFTMRGRYNVPTFRDLFTAPRKSRINCEWDTGTLIHKVKTVLNVPQLSALVHHVHDEAKNNMIKLEINKNHCPRDS